ncbi:MAG TPA: CBS domain-containing protein [Pirellulales bacterium]|nr:CBS domain-containing protein [Pirellulales bacterium]
MYQASDVMTTNVTTIAPDATVDEAIGVLLDNQISGLPVVDARGMLVGMISEFQLLETVFDPQIRNESVRGFMTRDVIAVDDGALLADVASLFIMHRIRRVPVLRDGQLVGLITRRDLLRYVAKAGDQIDTFLNEVRRFATERSKEAVVPAG